MSLSDSHSSLPHTIPPIELPVLWGDMDAFQHVNNTVYLRWCESARLIFFEKTGLMKTHKEAGIGPILASIQCRFRAPVVFPDTVSIHTTLTRMGTQDFDLQHVIYALQLQKTVAEVNERGVIYDYKQLKKADFPVSVANAFRYYLRP